MQNEIILNVFPGSNDAKRLVLVRTKTICGLDHLVLRQETYSPDVGWFVQSCVAIEPGQIASLKMTLSPANVAGSRSPGAVRTDSIRHSLDAPTVLRLHEAS